MKLCFLFIFSALLCSPLSVQAEEEEVEMAQDSLGLTSEKVEFILEEAGVKTQYDACKAAVGSNQFDGAVSDCLWNGNSANNILPLAPDQRDMITKRIDELSSSDGTGDANKDRFESLDTGFLKKTKQEPAFVALQKFMKEKLEKTIYGDASANKLSGADHMVFHELYKSQLSKNVISAMSSYCLDADPSDHFLVPRGKTELEAVRKQNLDQLTKPGTVNIPDPKDPNAPGKNVPTAQANFSQCINNLKNICYKTSSPYKSFRSESDIESDISGLEAKKAAGPLNPTDKSNLAALKRDLETVKNYEGSKMRSCNVVTYIKQLKQNIIAVSDITKKVEEHQKNSPGSGAILALGDSKRRQQHAVYNARDSKNETLTNITSKEFIEESGFKTAVEEEKEEFKKCLDQGNVVDEEACKKYLNKNKEEAQKQLAEADVRSRALEKKIDDKIKKEGKKGIEAYLTDQGYTEEEIKNMITDPTKMKSIEDQIRSRFDAERKAYIDNIAKKLDSKTILDEDKTISQSGDSKGKIKTIGEELAAKTENYTKLIHFNNIVSGFIETEDDNGKKGQNTNAMALELESSVYDPNAGTSSGGPSPASASGAQAHADAIKQALQANGIKTEFDDTEAQKSIQQGQINGIIEYDGVKKP